MSYEQLLILTEGVSEHLKKNWKKYAGGAAALGAGTVGYLAKTGALGQNAKDVADSATSKVSNLFSKKDNDNTPNKPSGPPDSSISSDRPKPSTVGRDSGAAEFMRKERETTPNAEYGQRGPTPAQDAGRSIKNEDKLIKVGQRGPSMAADRERIDRYNTNWRNIKNDGRIKTDNSPKAYTNLISQANKADEALKSKSQIQQLKTYPLKTDNLDNMKKSASDTINKGISKASDYASSLKKGVSDSISNLSKKHDEVMNKPIGQLLGIEKEYKNSGRDSYGK